MKANRTPLLKIGLFILLSAAVSPLFAAAQNTEQQKAEFIQLVKAGQLDQAYQLAEALEMELAGDPDFDMAYGRIALHVGQNDRAVFALERVVAEKPQWQQARFTLAQAYYKTKIILRLYVSWINLRNSHKQIWLNLSLSYAAQQSGNKLS